jgi:hypothetical protein
MYYKKYISPMGNWGVFKRTPNGEDNCIISGIDEIGSDRLLKELGAITELSANRPPEYRLVMFKDGWAIFLDSRNLPGGTLMIREKLLTDEMVNMLMALKKADLPEGWELF